jgi:GABA permease
MQEPHRLLVIANETIEGQALHDAVRARAAAPRTEVLVIAPALNTRLRHWMSDSDHARRAAEDRLVACVERLERAGVHARGWVGDADPLRAIDDALSVFSAREIIVATHPEERSNWLAHNLVERARARYDLPIVHVVVDLARHADYVAA